jgi:hypothetical protein
LRKKENSATHNSLLYLLNLAAFKAAFLCLMQIYKQNVWPCKQDTDILAMKQLGLLSSKDYTKLYDQA